MRPCIRPWLTRLPPATWCHQALSSTLLSEAKNSLYGHFLYCSSPRLLLLSFRMFQSCRILALSALLGLPSCGRSMHLHAWFYFVSTLLLRRHAKLAYSCLGLSPFPPGSYLDATASFTASKALAMGRKLATRLSGRRKVARTLLCVFFAGREAPCLLVLDMLVAGCFCLWQNSCIRSKSKVLDLMELRATRVRR